MIGHGTNERFAMMRCILARELLSLVRIIAIRAHRLLSINLVVTPDASGVPLAATVSRGLVLGTLLALGSVSVGAQPVALPAMSNPVQAVDRGFISKQGLGTQLGFSSDYKKGILAYEPVNMWDHPFSQGWGIPVGVDCNSPAKHSAFTSSVELMHFVTKLRTLSGAKPVGFKLCIGHAWEWFAMAKAMLKTGITPDFIVIDGAEGGTGAAPIEFVDHVGTPLREGLRLVHNTPRPWV